jgi:hypothetical protein
MIVGGGDDSSSSRNHRVVMIVVKAVIQLMLPLLVSIIQIYIHASSHIGHMFFFQGLAPVWAQAVASIFWKNL